MIKNHVPAAIEILRLRATLAERETELNKRKYVMGHLEAENVEVHARLAEARDVVRLIHERSTNPAPTMMSDRRVLDWVHGKSAAWLAKTEKVDG